jgi:hypothetical protein
MVVIVSLDHHNAPQLLFTPQCCTERHTTHNSIDSQLPKLTIALPQQNRLDSASRVHIGQSCLEVIRLGYDVSLYVWLNADESLPCRILLASRSGLDVLSGFTLYDVGPHSQFALSVPFDHLRNKLVAPLVVLGSKVFACTHFRRFGIALDASPNGRADLIPISSRSMIPYLGLTLSRAPRSRSIVFPFTMPIRMI